MRTLRLLVLAVAGMWPWANAGADALDDLVAADAKNRNMFSAAAMVSRARAGDPQAQAYIGRLLVEGSIGIRNVAAGIEWTRRACTAGHAQACFALGQEYDNGRYVADDPQEALYFFEKAYDAGIKYASLKIAGIYERGQIGRTRKDVGQIVFWYRRGADDGVAEAQRLLGFFFSRGQYVPRDYAASLGWFLKALGAHGTEYRDAHLDGSVQGMVGAYYEHGLGAAQNLERAAYWYQLGAQNKDPYAMYALGRLNERGEGVPRDLQQAMHWYRKAAGWGYAPAQYRLALACDRGEEGIPDPVQALKWLLLATGFDREFGNEDEIEEEFRKDPTLFGLDNWVLDPDAARVAERDLARIAQELSPFDFQSAVTWAAGFAREYWPIPIP